eukprot:1148431-Pelagomonas_calceolata.AAC.4
MDGVGAGHEASAPVPQEPGNGLCCRGNKGREAGGTGGARGGRAGMDAAAGAGTRAGGRPGYCVVAVGNECRAGAAWKESWPTSCSSGPASPTCQHHSPKLRNTTQINQKPSLNGSGFGIA